MKNEKKVGRPKKKVSRDIKLTVRVTDKENEKLEIISKKLGISKPELLRTFTLGTDEKSPENIFNHDKSFYPFNTELDNYIQMLKEKSEPYDIDDICDNLTDVDIEYPTTYEMYKDELVENYALKYYEEQYPHLDIRSCHFETINTLFKKHMSSFHLDEYNISTYTISDNEIIYEYNDMKFNSREDVIKYFLENEKKFEKIKDVGNDEIIALLYGKYRDLLFVDKFDKKNTMNIEPSL